MSINSHEVTTDLHIVVGLLIVATIGLVLAGGVFAALGDGRLLAAAGLAIAVDGALLKILGWFLPDQKRPLNQWFSAARTHFCLA
jgi:hypothetical protein